jgi:hypothetical protein
MVQQIKRNTQVPKDEWLRFFDDFAHDNQGRLISVATFGGSAGAEQLADSVPLLSINYDPRDKGDVLRIATGRREVEYEHRIVSPKEVWVADDEKGRNNAMEIIGENDDHIVVSLKQ